MEDDQENEKLARLARRLPPGYEGRPLHPRGRTRGFSAMLLGLVDNQPTRLAPVQFVFDLLPLFSVFIEWLQLMSIVGNVVLTLPPGIKGLFTVTSIADTGGWLSNASLDGGLYYTGLALCVVALVLMSTVLYCFWSGRDAAPPGVVFALRIVTRLQTTVLFLPVVRVMLNELRCATHPSTGVDISSSAPTDALPMCVAWRCVLAVLALLVQLPIGLFVAANSMQADPAAKDLTRRHNTLFDIVNLLLRFLASVISVFVRPVSPNAFIGTMLGLAVVYSTMLQLIQPYYSAWMTRIRSGLFFSLAVWCITALITVNHPHEVSSVTMLLPVIPAFALGMLLFRTRWRSYVVDAALTAVARPLMFESSAFFFHDYFLESLLNSPQRCGQYATFLSRFEDDQAASVYFAKACQYGVEGSHVAERSRWEERMLVMALSLMPALHFTEHVIRRARPRPAPDEALVPPNQSPHDALLAAAPDATDATAPAAAPVEPAVKCHLIDVEVGEGAAPKESEYALQRRLDQMDIPILHTNSVTYGAISLQRMLWSLIGGERASFVGEVPAKLRRALLKLDPHFPPSELAALCTAVEDGEEQSVEPHQATTLARAFASVLNACGNKAHVGVSAVFIGNQALITPTFNAILRVLPPLLISPVVIVNFRNAGVTDGVSVRGLLGDACRVYTIKIAHDSTKPKYRSECLKVDVQYPPDEMACAYCNTMSVGVAPPGVVHSDLACQEFLVVRIKALLAQRDASGGAFNLLELAATLGPRTRAQLLKVWRAMNPEGAAESTFTAQLRHLVGVDLVKLRTDGTVEFASCIMHSAVISTIQASDRQRWRLLNWVCGVTMAEDPSTKFWRRRHFMESWSVERLLPLVLQESIHFLLPGSLSFQSSMLAMFLSHNLALRDGFGSRTPKEDSSSNVHTTAENFLTAGVLEHIHASGMPDLSDAFDESTLSPRLQALVKDRPLSKLKTSRFDVIRLLSYYVIFELRVGFHPNAITFATDATAVCKRLARTPIERMEALGASCTFYAFQGNLAAANEDAAQIETLLAQMPNDFDGEGTKLRAMRSLAATARRNHDLNTSVHYYAAVVRMARASGVEHIDDVARGLSGLGMAYRDLKEYERGGHLIQEGLELFVWLGQDEFYKDSMHGLALLYTMETNFKKARHAFETVLYQGLKSVVGQFQATQCMVGLLETALLSGDWPLYDWCRAKLKFNKHRYPTDPRVMLLARARRAITACLTRAQYSRQAAAALAQARARRGASPEDGTAAVYPSPLEALLADDTVRACVAAAIGDPLAIKDMDGGRAMMGCVRESAIVARAYYLQMESVEASIHETVTATVLLLGLLRHPSLITDGPPLAAFHLSLASSSFSLASGTLSPSASAMRLVPLTPPLLPSLTGSSSALRPLKSLPSLTSAASAATVVGEASEDGTKSDGSEEDEGVGATAGSVGGGANAQAEASAQVEKLAFAPAVELCRRLMVNVQPMPGAPVEAVSGRQLVTWLAAQSEAATGTASRTAAVARCEELRVHGLLTSTASDERPFVDDSSVFYRYCI